MALVLKDRPAEETRSKLILAAGEVFAEVGFQAATTREICARAEVNIAAVNYHFRDKLGLYAETLKFAVSGGELPSPEHLQREKNPEKALRSFIEGMFLQMNRADRPAWQTKLMTHELSQPTPGLEAVVDHVIRPRALVLSGIVGRIIGRPANHPQTLMCTHSIIAQVVHYLHARPVIALLWPSWRMTPETLKAIAEHVCDFSLAALKNLPATSDTRTSRKGSPK